MEKLRSAPLRLAVDVREATKDYDAMKVENGKLKELLELVLSRWLVDSHPEGIRNSVYNPYQDYYETEDYYNDFVNHILNTNEMSSEVWDVKDRVSNALEEYMESDFF